MIESDIVRDALQTFARSMEELTIEWQQLEDTFATERQQADDVKDKMAAALGEAEARGGRRALEAVAASMFDVLAEAGS